LADEGLAVVILMADRKTPRGRRRDVIMLAIELGRCQVERHLRMGVCRSGRI